MLYGIVQKFKLHGEYKIVFRTKDGFYIYSSGYQCLEKFDSINYPNIKKIENDMEKVYVWNWATYPISFFIIDNKGNLYFLPYKGMNNKHDSLIKIECKKIKRSIYLDNKNILICNTVCGNMYIYRTCVPKKYKCIYVNCDGKMNNIVKILYYYHGIRKFISLHQDGSIHEWYYTHNSFSRKILMKNSAKDIFRLKCRRSEYDQNACTFSSNKYIGILDKYNILHIYSYKIGKIFTPFPNYQIISSNKVNDGRNGFIMKNINSGKKCFYEITNSLVPYGSTLNYPDTFYQTYCKKLNNIKLLHIHATKIVFIEKDSSINCILHRDNRPNIEFKYKMDSGISVSKYFILDDSIVIILSNGDIITQERARIFKKLDGIKFYNLIPSLLTLSKTTVIENKKLLNKVKILCKDLREYFY